MQTTRSRQETGYSVAAAWGCLVLAALSYPMFPTPLLFLVPPVAIIAIALGRAARHTLPPERNRERKVAAVGMVLAALPLGLVILGIVMIQVIVLITMITGVHCLGSCKP